MNAVLGVVMVLAVVVPMLMVMDAVMSRRAGAPAAWRELLSGAFWRGIGEQMTGTVNSWADDHDAAKAMQGGRGSR